MQVIGTFDALCRQNVRERPRGQQHRTILPATQASVSTDERFEGGDVERDVIHAAIDVEVRGLRHHDRATEHSSRVISVGPERILSGHFAGIEPNTAVGTDCPWHPGRVDAGEEANALVRAETRNELGPPLLQILKGEPNRGMDVQHAEVPRAKHSEVGAGHGIGALVDVSPAYRGSAAGGAATKAVAREVFGEGLHSPPIFDRGVDRDHFLVHEFHAHFPKVRAGPVLE